MPEPNEPAITVEVLPAAYGDSLLVSCAVRDGVWRLLVDTGPGESLPAVRDRLARLAPDERGRRQLDLLVITHIDHDHIGSVASLLADKTLNLTCGDVWFNGRWHLDHGRSVAEGEDLASVLGDPLTAVPWNLAFAGGPAATAGDGAFTELPAAPDHPRITLLSPTPKRLERLAKVWDVELERFRRGESNTKAEAARGSEFPRLDLLADQRSSPDRAPANGSSIAMLLEHRGASLLLAADAFPTVLGSALLSLAKHRGAAPPLAVDAFKLSHHGSRSSLMAEMFGAVRADHYLVSTSNARFGHPHDEALARVVMYGGCRPTLWFNYATEHNLRWADDALRERYGFDARFPESVEHGVTVELPPTSAHTRPG